MNVLSSLVPVLSSAAGRPGSPACWFRTTEGADQLLGPRQWPWSGTSSWAGFGWPTLASLGVAVTANSCGVCCSCCSAIMGTTKLIKLFTLAPKQTQTQAGAGADCRQQSQKLKRYECRLTSSHTGFLHHARAMHVKLRLRVNESSTRSHGEMPDGTCSRGKGH